MHICMYDSPSKRSSVFPPLSGIKRVVVENNNQSDKSRGEWSQNPYEDQS